MSWQIRMNAAWCQQKWIGMCLCSVVFHIKNRFFPFSFAENESKRETKNTNKWSYPKLNFHAIAFIIFISVVWKCTCIQFSSRLYDFSVENSLMVLKRIHNSSSSSCLLFEFNSKFIRKICFLTNKKRETKQRKEYFILVNKWCDHHQMCAYALSIEHGSVDRRNAAKKNIICYIEFKYETLNNTWTNSLAFNIRQIESNK